MKTTIKRGDVYWVNFDPLWGTRPGLVIQNDLGNKYAPTVILACITSTVSGKGYPVDVLLPDGLLPKKNSRVLAGNILTVYKHRMKDYIATLPENVMEEVDLALMVSFDLEKHRRP